MSVFLGIVSLLLGYFPAMRDSFPSERLRHLSQSSPHKFQIVGVVCACVGAVLIGVGSACYNVADTGLWRLTVCPRCKKIISTRNIRFTSKDVYRRMTKADIKSPTLTELCDCCQKLMYAYNRIRPEQAV